MTAQGAKQGGFTNTSRNVNRLTGEGQAGTRLSGQRQRILELLQERGTAGVTNNEICFRYGARLWELRRAGHNIKTENLGTGVFRFMLIPVREELPQSDVGLRTDDDYARRTRELRDQAMPLFSGTAKP